MAKLEFHKGIDYAVVMRPGETTETALCRLYGMDKNVTKFGALFAASPDLLSFAERVLFDLGRAGANSDRNHPMRHLWEAARDIITAATA